MRWEGWTACKAGLHLDAGNILLTYVGLSSDIEFTPYHDLEQKRSLLHSEEISCCIGIFIIREKCEVTLNPRNFLNWGGDGWKVNYVSYCV